MSQTTDEHPGCLGPSFQSRPIWITSPYREQINCHQRAEQNCNSEKLVAPRFNQRGGKSNAPNDRNNAGGSIRIAANKPEHDCNRRHQKQRAKEPSNHGRPARRPVPGLNGLLQKTGRHRLPARRFRYSVHWK